MTDTDIIISIRDVSKVYHMAAEEVHALRGVTLDIQRGQYVSIMGPSGSGKSTLFNMIGELQSSMGITVVAATHDMKMLSASDLVVWIKSGTVDRQARQGEVQIEVGTINGHAVA